MNKNALTITRFLLLEATRDRFTLLIVAGLVIATLISLFIGELAVTESISMQTATLAFLLRLFAVFTVSLFIISSMLREFHDKGFELVLSHPVNRTDYFLGKFLGFSAIALCVTFGVSICLLILVPGMDLLYWSLSLFCELLIVVSLSMLCLFTFNNVTQAFTAVAAFYLLARSIQTIQLLSDAPILAQHSISHQFMEAFIGLLAYIIPDLHRFTMTDWLVYGIADITSMLTVFLQTPIYVVLLSAAALFDLHRRLL